MVYLQDVLPQKRRGDRSPFECRNKRTPPIRSMHIKVFGCPCEYKPAPKKGEQPNKRGEVTESGWFCGMSWPKALVLRKRDMKLVSVSRKKLECHEGAYALADSLLSGSDHPFVQIIDPDTVGDMPTTISSTIPTPIPTHSPLAHLCANDIVPLRNLMAEIGRPAA